MKPYYDEAGITIYHGDALEVMPRLGERFDAIITDPVWPNATVPLAGSDDPAGLFGRMAILAPTIADRLVVHLGRDTDPRMLSHVPETLCFFAVCWLRFALPSYKGRLLNCAEVAYVFGEPPPARPGAMVIPGEVIHHTTEGARRPNGHPCPRRLQHAAWLVKWFGGASVIDPFMGSGTTLCAAKDHSIRAVGIEIEERYCEIAVKRLAQGALFPARHNP